VSKHYTKFYSILITMLLALPLLYSALILLPLTIINIIISWFSGAKTFLSIVGIILLLHLLSPPPPNKKKRITFVETFKALIKRFCKMESSETIVFKDNVVQFASYRQSSTECKLNYNYFGLSSSSAYSFGHKRSQIVFDSRINSKIAEFFIEDPPLWQRKYNKKNKKLQSFEGGIKKFCLGVKFREVLKTASHLNTLGERNGWREELKGFQPEKYIQFLVLNKSCEVELNG